MWKYKEEGIQRKELECCKRVGKEIFLKNRDKYLSIWDRK
jgi:hypothetical protein